MRTTVVVFVITLVREAVKVVGASAGRILTGRPANHFEQQAADLLKNLLQSAINRSRLMNPGVP